MGTGISHGIGSPWEWLEFPLDGRNAPMVIVGYPMVSVGFPMVSAGIPMGYRFFHGKPSNTHEILAMVCHGIQWDGHGNFGLGAFFNTPV